MSVVVKLGELVAFVGLVMVVAASISRVTARVLRISDEDLNDPWYRRNDTSGMSLAVHWMRPGLALLVGGAVFALVAGML